MNTGFRCSLDHDTSWYQILQEKWKNVWSTLKRKKIRDETNKKEKWSRQQETESKVKLRKLEKEEQLEWWSIDTRTLKRILEYQEEQN